MMTADGGRTYPLFDVGKWRMVEEKYMEGKIRLQDAGVDKKIPSWE